jgi:hypothetical protein
MRGCTGKGVGGGRSGEGEGSGGQRPDAAAGSDTQEGRGGRCTWGRLADGVEAARQDHRPGHALGPAHQGLPAYAHTAGGRTSRRGGRRARLSHRRRLLREEPDGWEEGGHPRGREG